MKFRWQMHLHYCSCVSDLPLKKNATSFLLLNDKFTSFIKNTKTLKFVEAKLVESELRHKRFGGSRYVVEPNVKDGKGGLRDLHTLIWISKFAYKVDSVSKLINMGALSKKEAASFAESSAAIAATAEPK